MADEYEDPQTADPHWPPKRYHHCICCYAKHRNIKMQICASCLKADGQFKPWLDRLVTYMPARWREIARERDRYIHECIYTPNRKAFESLQQRGGKKKSPKWIRSSAFLPPVPKSKNGTWGKPKWMKRCKELYVKDNRGASVQNYWYL